MDATYEVGGQGSEHVHKRQRQPLTKQLPFLHRETRSHNVAMSTGVLQIGCRGVLDPQELLCKSSCGSRVLPMSPANRRPADPSVIAAIHHPLRRRLIDLLGVEGPATASQLAERTGELVGNISHHLKVLAAAGVIEEAPELATNRRERWWRHARAAYNWSGAAPGCGTAAELIANASAGREVTHHSANVR